mmetsp:Transcript_21533/g.61333  ORF Transcript_21533/g.61333 Transcript_21533/m.61333 type:complete len:86 (+) Transcript_21533:649-906(+)
MERQLATAATAVVDVETARHDTAQHTSTCTCMPTSQTLRREMMVDVHHHVLSKVQTRTLHATRETGRCRMNDSFQPSCVMVLAHA